MILYFEQNSNYTSNDKIKNFFIECDILETLTQLNCYDPLKGSFYNRCGFGEFPLKNNFKTVPGFAMPNYDPDFNKTWDIVTDDRCTALRLTHFNRPWVVLWSGGIDSTNVVAAIIKNLPKSDFENITIACNPISVWENPYFYYNFIEPNFKTVDSRWTLTNECIEFNNYLFNGEPGDQLFTCCSIVSNQPKDYPFQPLTDELLFDFICSRTDKKFAAWFHQFFVDNVKSVGIPLNTLHDAVWWSQFNFNWVGVKMRALHYGDWAKLKNARVYFDKFIHWYDSVDYQRWSMVNNIVGEKFGSNFSDIKLAAKKYIYNIDKNTYYKDYKTKMRSGDISSNVSNSIWCCMLDNYDLLNLRDHEDQILELLPDHLNFKEVK